MADRRPRRTRVWWLVGTDDVVVSIYVKRKRAVEVRVPVIEAPARRGRKRKT